MEKKEEKKGFWTSLFTPKQSSCCGSVIEEVPLDEQTKEEKPVEEENKPKEENTPKCSCGGNC